MSPKRYHSAICAVTAIRPLRYAWQSGGAPRGFTADLGTWLPHCFALAPTVVLSANAPWLSVVSHIDVWQYIESSLSAL
jgi:hypothetical protein